jgi:hypothetical protein
VFTAAGDIDGCNAGADTAKLVEKTTGPVATIGDNAYPGGSASDYSNCYDPTWGAFKDRTHPVPGNHDYDVTKATPYYQYFGAAAGTPGSGWYSYDVGSWHVVALNSNCDAVDCGKQANWLDGDLTANPAACILAYWHHPRFTSGTSGGNDAVGAFWKVLYAHQATLVLNGHDHDYERFAPQDPSGHADPAHGIREFVVGTGGASLGSFAGVAPNSQVRNNGTYGVIELTLGDGGYDWRFVPVGGSHFTDSGSDTCRGTGPAPPTTAAPGPPPQEALPPAPAPDPGPDQSGPPATAAPSPGPSSSALPPGADAGGPAPGGRSGPTAPPPRPPVSTPDRRPRPSVPASAGAATGSGGDPARPAPSGPATPIGADSVIAVGPGAPGTAANATADPSTAGASPATPLGGGANDPATGPPPSSSPGREAGAPADGGDVAGSAEPARLPLAIARLIHPPPPPSDRRPLAALAFVLLAADAAALGAVRRRRRSPSAA